jgi:hypothetical protein
LVKPPIKYSQLDSKDISYPDGPRRPRAIRKRLQVVRIELSYFALVMVVIVTTKLLHQFVGDM